MESEHRLLAVNGGGDSIRFESPTCVHRIINNFPVTADSNKLNWIEFDANQGLSEPIMFAIRRLGFCTEQAPDRKAFDNFLCGDGWAPAHPRTLRPSNNLTPLVLMRSIYVVKRIICSQQYDIPLCRRDLETNTNRHRPHPLRYSFTWRHPPNHRVNALVSLKYTISDEQGQKITFEKCTFI